MGINQAIKETALKAVENSRPVNIFQATVTKVKPYEIKGIENNLVVSDLSIIVPKALDEFPLWVGDIVHVEQVKNKFRIIDLVAETGG
jgi:hypothetical protein